MTTKLKLIDGKAAAGGLEVSEKAFGRDFNEALVHQVVTAYMAQASGQAAKPDQFGKARRNIARVKTVQAELARAAETRGTK